MKIELPHPVPITVISQEEINGPIYHPAVPDKHAWQAGNKAASKRQAVEAVVSNAARYLRLVFQSPSPLDRKLAMKSAVVELKTLVDLIPRLHSTLTKIPVQDSSGLKPEISVATKERAEIDRRYRVYNQRKSEVEALLHDIRNSIGAHHAHAVVHRPVQRGRLSKRAGAAETLTWDEITDLWDRLEPDNFKDLFLAAKGYLEYARTLDIYEWFRYEGDGTLRTLGPLVGTMEGNRLGNVRIMGSELTERFGVAEGLTPPDKPSRVREE